MAEGCTHDCGSCSASCSSRKPDKSSFLKPLHPESRVKHVIAVASGKGGVGKSSVTSFLAALLARKCLSVAVLDADITGPSIPKAFGCEQKAQVEEGAMYPAFSMQGVQIMSSNMLLENETDPVIWRGPIIAGVVSQFWTDVIWTDVDVMLVDMPPGTGDVPLTVFQSLPVDGLIVVSSPQQLVSMIVEKAIKMSEMMDIPILGLVENYSYYKCPDCGKKDAIFGESHINELAKEYGIDAVANLPIQSSFAHAFDLGQIESYCNEELESALRPVLEPILTLCADS